MRLSNVPCLVALVAAVLLSGCLAVPIEDDTSRTGTAPSGSPSPNAPVASPTPTETVPWWQEPEPMCSPYTPPPPAPAEPPFPRMFFVNYTLKALDDKERWMSAGTVREILRIENDTLFLAEDHYDRNASVLLIVTPSFVGNWTGVAKNSTVHPPGPIRPYVENRAGSTEVTWNGTHLFVEGRPVDLPHTWSFGPPEGDGGWRADAELREGPTRIETLPAASRPMCLR